MKHTLNIDKTLEYDVVVAGGGMTGFAAAVSAARSGKKTILIEKGGCLGGVATAGAVTCLLGGINYEDEVFKFVTGGLFKELYYELREKNECVDIYKINRNRSPHAWYTGLAESIIFDNEAMKRLLDRKLLESGSDLLYFTQVIGVKANGEKLEYILAANKDGINAVYGKVFIDCTGDGDLADLSGCSMVKGRDGDELMMPTTLIMDIENVDTEKLLTYIEKNNSPRFREEIKKLRKEGSWDFPFDIFISMLLNREGHHMINSIRQVGIDGTDAVSITRGMVEGRDEGKRLFDTIKANFDGYEKAKIATTAETLGVRETKRIVGKYMLTFEDLIEGKDFDDVIAISSYCFDVPDPKKPSLQPKEGVSTKKKYAEVPYSCMIPDKMNNLIMAGRSISVERIVMGPLRVMGPCIGMGQAAGFAASIAIDKDKSFEDVDINELKAALIDADCIIKEDDVCIVRNGQ